MRTASVHLPYVYVHTYTYETHEASNQENLYPSLVYAHTHTHNARQKKRNINTHTHTLRTADQSEPTQSIDQEFMISRIYKID